MGVLKSTIIQQLLFTAKDRLSTLCKQFNVEKLYLFGSATTDHFSSASDLDLIVSFRLLDKSPEEQGQLYWDFLDALEQLFGRKIDLLTDREFNNPYFQKEVEKTKTLIYDRSQGAQVLF